MTTRTQKSPQSASDAHRPAHSTDAPKGSQLASRIEDISPEGRPAYPGLGARGIALTLLFVFALVIIAALAAGAMFGSKTGVIVGIVLAGLAIVFNPAVWVAILRGRERERALRQAKSR